MVVIKSERAKGLLNKPKAFNHEFPSSQMRKFPGNELNIGVYLERDKQNVKNLSFAGTPLDYEKVILEALSALIKGRPLALLENLSLRECEAYLRDRNSELALENLSSDDEVKFKKLFQWIRVYPEVGAPVEYHFSTAKGPFQNLKLIDKVKELKAFLNSTEVQYLYKDCLRPELIDVDDLTVFIQAPYDSDADKSLFEELHILGVATFQEENLNFIPEA